jgi:predicted helicase
VLLLPYYIAAQNIEYAYYERTGSYAPFAGLCFADTLDLGDSPQAEMFAPANTARIQAQKQAPIRVVIGNPPYNAWQESENDNNKNRKYPTIDKPMEVILGSATNST